MKLFFYGELGYIVVPNYWKSNQLDLYLDDGSHSHYDFPYQSEFVYEIEHIHQCINNGRLESPIMNKEKLLKQLNLLNSYIKNGNKRIFAIIK